MKRRNLIKRVSRQKHLIDRPTPLTELDLLYEDMEDANDYSWHEKARRLQARRWRRIKHQTA